MKKISLAILFVLFYLVSAGYVYAGVRWTVDGEAVCNEGDRQEYPAITGDGAGGAIIAWKDYRWDGTGDIFAQRIDENGNVKWAINGASVCTQGPGQGNPAITGDGTGGAIITWTDYRDTQDIYAQRIDENGNVKWVINGASVCTQGSNQDYPAITGDGTGGAIVTWYDSRNGNYDIFAQRIDEDGNVLWGADAAVCRAGGNQSLPEITGDGTGGAIIAWNDDRNGVMNRDIYSQRIDEDGNAKWVIDGASVCTQGSGQGYPAITGDGTGGAIITWRDDRNGAGNGDIYAQRISNPAPIITSINPQSAAAGDTLDVAVNGSWFYINPSLVFSGAGITLNTVSRVSEAELTVNITISRDAAAGTRDVSVTNLDGQSGAKTRAFEVMEPAPGPGPGEGKVKIQAGNDGWANPLRGEEVNIYLKPKHSGNVSIEIYTIAGQLVWDKEISVTGGVQEQVVWNCRNKSDEVVSSGIYVVRVKGGGIDTVKKVAVVK